MLIMVGVIKSPFWQVSINFHIFVHTHAYIHTHVHYYSISMQTTAISRCLFRLDRNGNKQRHCCSCCLWHVFISARYGGRLLKAKLLICFVAIFFSSSSFLFFHYFILIPENIGFLTWQLPTSRPTSPPSHISRPPATTRMLNEICLWVYLRESIEVK